MRLIVKATVSEQVNVMDYTEGYRVTRHSSKGEKNIACKSSCIRAGQMRRIVTAIVCELVNVMAYTEGYKGTGHSYKSGF